VSGFKFFIHKHKFRNKLEQNQKGTESIIPSPFWTRRMTKNELLAQTKKRTESFLNEESDNPAMIFQKYVDISCAYNIAEEAIKNIKKKIKSMLSEMDKEEAQKFLKSLDFANYEVTLTEKIALAYPQKALEETNKLFLENKDYIKLQSDIEEKQAEIDALSTLKAEMKVLQMKQQEYIESARLLTGGGEAFHNKRTVGTQIRSKRSK